MTSQKLLLADRQADLLLAKRCEREECARDELIRRYSLGLFRILRRIIGNPADAEDLLQDVFVSVFQSIHSYRGEASLETWLRRVAVRWAIRFCKNQRARPLLQLVENQAEDVVDPRNVVDQRAALRRIHQILQKLAHNRRALFVLHQIEGYPLAEAAAIVGVTLTAAKKLVCRARQDLIKMAQEDPLLLTFLRNEREAR